MPADAEEIYVSESVYEAEGVKPQLEALSIDSTMARLRGIQQDVRAYRTSRRRGRRARAVLRPHEGAFHRL
jgi:class 3 adenylate cyclase